MSRKKSYITVTDQFCGAGGSSQGVTEAGLRAQLNNGLQVVLAMNHWNKAIETHAANFPGADHVSTDISACDPRDYVSTDILITSPECTNHSVAKGKKQVKAQMDMYAKGKADPAAERSRATMWDVVRFAEYHKYNVIITENVVDVCAWVLIEPWLKAMQALGYLHERHYLNSMFCWPTPQRRDRVYYVFWRKGNKRPNIDIRPLAPCPKCGNVRAIQRFKPGASIKAKYGTQYTYVCPTCAKDVMPYYFAAINAIDFSIPAVRIGDRKDPLEPRTMQRIAYGMEKYGNRPLTLTNAFSSGIAPRVDDATSAPWFPIHSFSNRTGVAHPGFLVGTEYDDPRRVKGLDDAFPAQTGRRTTGVAMPFTLSLNYPDQRPAGVDEALHTVTGGRMTAITIPPGLFVSTSYFDENVRVFDGVLPAQTSGDKLGVLSPFMVKMRGTEEGHLRSAAYGADEPIGTISAGGMHHALVSGRAFGFLASYYKSLTHNGLDDPMGALKTVDTHGLVVGDSMRIEDMYFRMCAVSEIKAGMAFAPDYILTGNKRENVKMLGNAVTPPAMRDLVGPCIETLM